MASKWEAFKGRGQNDYRTSKDFEDLVYILENVDNFEEQLRSGPRHVRNWLKDEIEPVMNNDDFEEGLYAHLTGGYIGIDANYLRQKLKAVFDVNET